ncbi:MAG: SPASM domain-containing protein [Selenomonas sp.]|nr:SPASM domain-containing protein [Selenomonas sp.]
MNYDTLDKGIRQHAQDGRYALEQHHVNKVCYRPFIKLLVATNGDICAACCDHILGRDKVYGNIYKESLVDVWQGKVHCDFMEMQLCGERFHHLLCKDCVVPNDIANERDSLDLFAAVKISWKMKR